MAKWFDVGDVARLSVSFTDADGALADPSNVALTVRDPAGASTTPTVTQDDDDTGHYYADVALASAGTWYWRWAGTGANAAATEGTISVRVSNFTA